MKVSTDACLQGAWAPVGVNSKSVLDIGAGSGLLSLMIAQRFNEVKIDAVEIDENAAAQANENVQSSPFADRINVIRSDVNSWSNSKKYDFIICNPPFFIDSLKGPEAARNNARHNISLSQRDLVAILKKYLDANGRACFLWPSAEHQQWENELKTVGLYLYQLLLVKDNEAAKVKRIISTCGFVKPYSIIEAELIIKNRDGSYTDDFNALLQAFYLKL